MKGLTMLESQFDAFNGVIISATRFSHSETDFNKQLNALIVDSHSEGKQLIWLTLDIAQSFLIKSATDKGFVFHNCLEDQLTLILRLIDNAYAPFRATYSIGAGAIVINDNNEILIIRERLASGLGYKLPGGHIELGEKIAEAIVREVYEETGILTEFKTIQGLATKHPYRFSKSNMYIICSLKALSSEINIQDTHEIIDAKWLDIDSYLNDPTHSPFNRQLIGLLRNVQGLKQVEVDHNQGAHKKHEFFCIEE
jgi:mutator protein MutT